MKRRTGVTKGRRISSQKAGSSKTGGQKTANRKSKPLHNTMDEIEGMYKPIKKPVTLRLDADVLDWFKKQGQGYQTRINRALRTLMINERKK